MNVSLEMIARKGDEESQVIEVEGTPGPPAHEDELELTITMSQLRRQFKALGGRGEEVLVVRARKVGYPE